MTKEDLQQISELMDEKLKPIKEDIKTMKSDIANIKEDIEIMKEDFEEVRGTVAEIGKWVEVNADRYSNPYPVK